MGGLTTARVDGPIPCKKYKKNNELLETCLYSTVIPCGKAGYLRIT